MSDGPRGLPLLSGPAPTLSENSSSQSSESCRKCGKEFNMLFLRSRKCNHCGYLYCHNCSDYQALMPRQGALEYTGYDATNVCGYCIEYLTITAGGRNHLKSLPIGKLRKYANAYNIKIDRAVEKDDIIEALMTTRTQHGCLPPANEYFYRTYSVPAAEHRSGLRNIFRSNQAETPANPPPPPPPRTPQSTFARPDIAPDPPSQSTRPPPPPPSSSTRPYQPYTQQRQPRPYQAQYGPPPRPPPRPTSHAPQQQQHTPPSQQEQTYYGGQPSRGYNNYGPPPPPPPRGPYHSSPPAPPPVFGSSNSSGGSNGARRRPAPQQQQSSAPTPTPTLAALLTMSPSSIKSLSIGTLKSILFTNHVNASHVLEKEELVNKVMVLVEEEKSERERQRRVEEMEEMERVQRERGVDADVDVDSSDDDDEQEEEDHRHGYEEGGRSAEDINEHDGETRTAAEARQAQQATPRIHIVNLGPSESDNEDEDTQQYQRPRSNSANISASPTDPPVTIPDTNTLTDDSDHRKSAPKKVHKHKLSPPKPSLQERSGLCVVCQDEEANIAIVDCGHLAMCRACSELIMESSRECPLCRTRIVTEARLLRIFKT